MIRFRIYSEKRVTPSVAYICEVCKAENFRGLAGKADSRPFECWNCLNKLPTLVTLVKNRQARVELHKTGKIPKTVMAGLY